MRASECQGSGKKRRNRSLQKRKSTRTKINVEPKLSSTYIFADIPQFEPFTSGTQQRLGALRHIGELRGPHFFRAALRNQELRPNRGGPSYWEGAVDYTGSHTGVGYLEMTGYDAPVKLP